MDLLAFTLPLLGFGFALFYDGRDAVVSSKSDYERRQNSNNDPDLRLHVVYYTPTQPP